MPKRRATWFSLIGFLEISPLSIAISKRFMFSISLVFRLN